MKTNYLLGTAIAAATMAGALTLASGAQAAELFHGAYYGTGNDYAPGNWTVETYDQAELGLRAHETGEAALAPTGNTYDFALGQNVSFDWSFDPKAVTRPLPGRLPDSTFSITITDLTRGGTAVFDPSSFSETDASVPGGFQDSEQLSFGFLNGTPFDINYDANVASTYDVSFNIVGRDGNAFVTDNIVIRQGGGGAVPEPASWALMLLGFGGIGAMLRRRRTVYA